MKVSQMNYERELEFACRLATAAGENAKLIRTGGISAETKSELDALKADIVSGKLVVESAASPKK